MRTIDSVPRPLTTCFCLAPSTQVNSQVLCLYYRKSIHARAEAASASKAAGILGCGSLVHPRPHLAPESSWDSSHEFSKWSQAPYLCSMTGGTVSSCPPPVSSLQDRFLNSLPSETAEHCFLTQTNLRHFIHRVREILGPARDSHN